VRSYQERAFDTADKERTLRSVIATLAGSQLRAGQGGPRPRRSECNQAFRVSVAGYVTVRPRGSSQMLVRANAQQGEMTVEDPKPYQDFFAALEKSMF